MERDLLREKLSEIILIDEGIAMACEALLQSEFLPDEAEREWLKACLNARSNLEQTRSCET
jgi:hypothetical protein